jgi:hypothetical protein
LPWLKPRLRLLQWRLSQQRSLLTRLSLLMQQNLPKQL